MQIRELPLLNDTSKFQIQHPVNIEKKTFVEPDDDLRCPRSSSVIYGFTFQWVINLLDFTILK